MVDYTKPNGLTKIWGATGVKTPAPSDAKISAGWVPEIPAREYFNYLDNKQDAMLAHINQYGIPAWDANTPYQATKSYAMGSNGIVYRASSDSGPPSTAVNPVGDVSGTWLVAFYLTTQVYTKSETDGAYLFRASNLSDLANTTTARTNLNVYSKGETDGRYPAIANNLSDVNASTARTNLSVYSKSETDGKYPAIANNLSDVNAASARSNLGVSSVSEANALYNTKIANLSDVPNPAAARTNLDLYSKSETDGKYLPFTGNLTGLASPAASFDNIKQAASDGYAGVSAFSSDSELLGGTVTNKAVAPSKLRLGFAANLSINGYLQLPSWLLGVRFEWGRANVNSSSPLAISMAFPNNCFLFIPSLAEAPDQANIAISGYITSNTVATINYFHGGSTDVAPFMWFAIGN